ncbi:YycH protein [Thermoanaerobacterium thermosaccharolyticum]|uniref:YycH protein n=1 Tax=Thermoanaerobacterium thermosaccharolyticum TaxID=1517 RepID=A0A223HY12_THETR|nr:two-component system activity regulator YycH [Thermoanaerobacterium thermosaccharolyticum]AST57351.1 YycH protein [Thermoanaerobacterium thermosaccharolyticum]
MKEHIKTIVLVLLVSTSLYLSYTLWTSFPQKSFFMTKSTPSSVDIFSIVRPSSIEINANDTFRDITSSNDITSIWANTIKTLKDNLDKGIALSQVDKSSINLRGNLIYIDMGKGITKDIFTDALNLESLSELNKINSDAYIKEIIIKVGSKPQIIFTDYNNYFVMSLKNSRYFDELIGKQFQNSIDYVMTTADDVYSENVFTLKNFTLGKYVNKGFANDSIYRTITKNVFVNISVVREIKENNGSYIYTDGIRGLRLYRNGLIEYFDTTTTSTKLTMSKIESLNKALEFIKDLGINVDDVYITGVSGSGTEYNFSFNYIFDYPICVIRNGEKSEPIDISVSNGIIKTAKVNFMDIYYAGDYKSNLYNIQKAIVDNKIKGVESLKLVYVFDGTELIPAWDVKCIGNEYLINALDGKII